ncbi:ATP-binding protein [Beijerinckia sp. L45]|uniref:ATP-binding protein n=1 Tax=Beijerinckia sp. L45 TaxID=1641855 RepID=UPI00131B0E6E|nr:ATP-binding protein [Beijerinckia sp. L45]
MNFDADGSDVALLRHQTALARFGELALRSDDLDEILTEACRLAAQALGTDLAKVVELQQDGKTLLVRAGIGWKSGVVGVTTVLALDDTSEDHALRTGEPMISPDIETETRFRYAPFLIDNGVRAVANVIIIGGSGKPPFGILQIDSRTPRQFTDKDTDFLRTYANLLAAAVDRLHVLKEVRDAQARLRLAIEAGELGSWELDLASGTAWRSTRCDQIFGDTDPNLPWTFDTFLSHVVLEDRPNVALALQHAIDDLEDWHFQCRIRRANDHALRWIETHGRPDGIQHDKNKPRHLLGIVTDITSRKEDEALLLQSKEGLEAMVAERTRALTLANARLEAEAIERERVEEALRQSHKMEAVGQLTGGLAHDFNNLVGIISGNLELARMRAGQGRVAELERYIEPAMTAAKRATALTHRLLAFSRLQTLDPRPIDMNALVNGMEELFRQTVGPSVAIECRLMAALWPTLCDSNQLENALLNLVINARDAMPDGGHLEIETRNAGYLNGSVRDAAAETLPPGDYVVLSVTDAGSGMTPDVITRAFDPFFTTKPVGKGTGLGLSMVYGFVKQSGGHVTLRSAAGKGTTVTIYLPRNRGAITGTVASVTALHMSPAQQGAVILVVDDEAAMRGIVIDVLSDLGYGVLQAADGASGLLVVESGVRIDLLLTDVGLPGGMSGRQFAAIARGRRPALKVLFITGYAESAALANGWMENGMEVLTKPFAIDVLAAKVTGMVDESSNAADPTRAA